MDISYNATPDELSVVLGGLPSRCLDVLIALACHVLVETEGCVVCYVILKEFINSAGEFLVLD